MTAADQYRVKAAELADRARQEKDPTIRRELETLAAGYVRLALQAEANTLNDVATEFAPKTDGTQSQPMQQQQSQLKKSDE